METKCCPKLWDPLRRKMVALTPEERVRQWFISVLRDELSVPVPMMMSEVPFKFGQELIKKEYRADIVVYDRSLRPMMSVECKRPEIPIDDKVVGQALKYNMVLDVKYLVLTNGSQTCIWQRERDGFRRIASVPKYEEMILQ